MNPTHPGPAVPADGHDDTATSAATSTAGDEATTVDTTSTPAAVLRRAAVYLQRHGWTTERLYGPAGPGKPWPRSDAQGAIRIAVFGDPIETLYAQPLPGVDQAVYEANCEVVITAELALAMTIVAVDEFGAGIDLSVWRARDVVSAWNDEPGRTADQVIGMLHTAASRFETDPATFDRTTLGDADQADEDPGEQPDEFGESVCICDPDATRQIVVVWADSPDEEPGARIFTPDQYADWAETNYLTGAFCWPVGFYGVFATGELAELVCTGEVGDYDEDDYAQVTYTFTLYGHTRPVAIGVTRRDGRA